MNPFESTIVRQSAAIFGVFALAGLLLAAGYGLYQYSKLHHAMTLNMLPGQLP